ncbi:hypothetical protein KUTeg_000803 [Tegillarca granosa]|uniref:Uncharacterized protein n=1 Tax=Tegillarca granosa TaxID=220873 RepID=A0ABQ9G1Z2_TEGGR|nr:hypothetical protein KUTeg_000803 [Tegillarca granosa]
MMPRFQNIVQFVRHVVYANELARITLPYYLHAINLEDQEVGVFAQQPISCKSQFGPFEAKKTTHEFNDDGLFMLKIFTKDGGCVSLDTTDENECNWLCLVRAASNYDDQNCMAYQLGTSIFYNTTRDIKMGEELKVWYAPQYAKKVGKPTSSDGISKVMLGMKVLYPTVDELPEVSIPSVPATDEPGSSRYDLLASIPLEEPNEEESQEQNKTEAKETISTLFSCKRCDQKFDTEIELGSHIREHLLPPPRKGGRRSKKRSPERRNSMKHLLSSLNLNRNENAKSKQSDDEILESSDDDVEMTHESEDEFSPKQSSKVESPNRRVMPRRSLRGVRTTGFEEYVVMTKSVAKRKRQVSISSDGEENNEKHDVSIGNVMVIGREKERVGKKSKTDLMKENMENNDNSKTRKRGRPRKKQENEQISGTSELTKISLNDIDLEKGECTANDTSKENGLSKNEILNNKLVEMEAKDGKYVEECGAESEKVDDIDENENNQVEKDNAEIKKKLELISEKEKEQMESRSINDSNEKQSAVAMETENNHVNQSDSYSQTEYGQETEVLIDVTSDNELDKGHRDPTDVKGQKPKCEHCDRTFVKSYDLNRHYQVTHSGMMYVCEFCNARCSHRHTVMRHYKRKHPSHAHLIKDPAYLNGIFKVVDKEYMKEELVKELTQDTSQILIDERGEILPQTAAEVLHSLSSGGPGNITNIQTVHVTNDGIIDSNGMMVLPSGTDETFSVQSLQPNSQSIVILQIVNPQDADQIMTEEVQVQELETTQIIETTPLPEVTTDAVAEEITAVTTFVQNFGS